MSLEEIRPRNKQYSTFFSFLYFTNQDRLQGVRNTMVQNGESDCYFFFVLYLPEVFIYFFICLTRLPNHQMFRWLANFHLSANDDQEATRIVGVFAVVVALVALQFTKQALLARVLYVY